MKAKILLIIAALAAASFSHAQLPGKFMSSNKIPPNYHTTTRQQSLTTLNTNSQVMVSGSDHSSAISIDYTNNLVPVEANDDNVFIFDQQIPVPGAGQNQVFDFGNLTYEPENLFTNALVRPPLSNMVADRTAYQSAGNAIDFNGLLTDTLFLIYATNDQGLYITKVHFTAARVSLESVTSVVTDSLIIPEQTVILPQVSLVQKYPTTYKTQWMQNPGKSGPTVFISLASEQFDHAPVQIVHEHKFVHQIVGWGKMRVPLRMDQVITLNVFWIE